MFEGQMPEEKPGKETEKEWLEVGREPGKCIMETPGRGKSTRNEGCSKVTRIQFP